ncbi:MAG: 1-acyl-sn-glycerol-3-phosphate acyltransferase [Ruminococcus sp.]|nr:1-acyl-sn-glycerol-3-phosphate acyltransferase [Ruminococcus sp.]
MKNDKIRVLKVYGKLICLMYKYRKMLNDNHINNHAVCQRICRELMKSFSIDCEICGLDNIPENDCLIISNHISFFDIIVFLAVIEKPVSFAYAENLLRLPILRKYISSLGGVCITSSKIKSILNGIHRALKQSSLIVFPEGKCSYSNDNVQQFQRGCFVNFKDLKTPILPVYLKYDKIHSFNKWVTPEKKIQIIINKSFFPDENMNSKQLSKYCHDIVAGSGNRKR